MRNIYKALSVVQASLKAPKGNRNTFGNYNYRSAEDILEAVKPLLASNDLAMTLSDTVVQVGDKNYIKAQVTIFDLINDSPEVSVTAFAREAVEKKGMDDAQITGAASSYARKYALNGMFNIDDTKDADTDEHHKQTNKAPKEVRDRVAESKAGSEPMGENPDDILARAKKAINEALEAHEYTRVDQKKAFITIVLEKDTIDSIDDAELVMDAIENDG